jgi:hypothetical protein
MQPNRERAPSRSRKNATHLTVWAPGFLFLVLALTAVSFAGPPESSTAAKFLAQQDEPLTRYRAYRRMHAWTDKFDQQAWLDAWTELDHTGLKYTIISERGSEFTRNRVLKAVLKREQELVAAGNPERGTLSPENYQFADSAANDDTVRYVLLKPKRKDVMLVDGRMVLSPDATELLRVEGRLAKNPSFWTSWVDVIRTYGRLDGIRVPLATESVAKVKFVGTSRLDVQYDYETINGRPVSLVARRLQASLR